jgi:putative phosphoribosyl transferase
MLFRDRADAGQVLAAKLMKYANRPNVVVLGLPRGGIPVAFEVARALHAPLDVFLVRKLGVPWQPEYAMGAIASGAIRVLNDEAIERLRIPEDVIESVAREETDELERREKAYRDDQPPPNLRGRTVILVDDGLATGSTMRAAIAAVRQLGPMRVVVAVPVGHRETCLEFEDEADEVICARMPEPFYGVGQWYGDFSQTTDDEVRDLLEQAAEWRQPT